MLLNLRNVLENPPSLNVFLVSEVLDAVNAQGTLDESKQMPLDTEMTADNIDWDITVDSSQIDWDIGTVEETEDTSNGLGPYEIVNASEILLNDDFKSDQTVFNKDHLVPEVSGEICWDISVENSQVEVIQEGVLTNILPETQSSRLTTLSESQGNNQGRSQLLETEYRSKILDDLFEV